MLSEVDAAKATASDFALDAIVANLFANEDIALCHLISC
jgi:hypothetical protein